MRSHVMKGKNIGKTMRRASRLSLAKPQRYNSRGKANTQSSCNSNDGDKNTYSQSLSTVKNLGFGLVGLPFPFELNQYTISIMNQCK
jgi:hypothetical protein